MHQSALSLPLLLLLGLWLLQAEAANWKRAKKEVNCSTDKKMICGPVRAVHDADTIRVGSSGSRSVKVRLFQIDAPELSQAYGHAATAALKAKLPIGSRVCIVSAGTDYYNRVLGFVCSVTDEDVNGWLVSNGYAWCYRNRCSKHYKQLQRQAEAARQGLWQQSARPMAPWTFRKQQRKRQRDHLRR